jgi:hypothetical protein
VRILHIRQSGTEFMHFRSDSSENLANLLSNAPSTSRSTKKSDPEHGSKVEEATHKFAQFAFGPKGLLLLQVIALGDFCYDGRFAQTTAFLVRSALGNDATDCSYRQIRHEDYEQRVLIDKYYDALSACPTSARFE